MVLIKTVCTLLILSLVLCANSFEEIISLHGTEATRDSLIKVQKKHFPALPTVRVRTEDNKITWLNLQSRIVNYQDSIHKKRVNRLESQILKLYGKPYKTNKTDKRVKKYWALDTGDSLKLYIRMFQTEDSIPVIGSYGFEVFNGYKSRRYTMDIVKRERDHYKKTSVKGSRSFESFERPVNRHQFEYIGIYYNYMQKKLKKNPRYKSKGMIVVRFHVRANGELVKVEKISSAFDQTLNEQLLKRMSEIKFSPIEGSGISTFDYTLGLENKLLEYYELHTVKKEKKKSP